MDVADFMDIGDLAGSDTGDTGGIDLSTTVKITEMYDLSTTLGKVGVIGVHTPNALQLESKYRGLIANHKFMKILGCDISVACASTLPADPAQVGVEAGDIAPQDMFNPILYRAVTNDSWNYVVGRIYDSSTGSLLNSLVVQDFAPSNSAAANESVYYQLLADSGWRKAMPQSGFSMRGLKPLVHSVVNTFGNTNTATGVAGTVSNLEKYANTSSTPSVATGAYWSETFKGPAMPYPRLPCTVPGQTTNADNPGVPTFTTTHIPTSFVACIVMPPGKLQQIYYRLVVSWYVRFESPVSLIEKFSNINTFVSNTAYSYNTGLSFTSAKELSEGVPEDSTVSDSDLISTVDVNIEKVMSK